jgi:hypothetical protein
MWFLVGSGNRDRRRGGMQGAALGLFSLAVAVIPAGAQQTDIGWPRTVQSNSETIEIYQPQVDKWEGGKLEARAAMVVTEKDAATAIYGVVDFSARTTLDQSKRLVTLYDLEVTNAKFPSARTVEPNHRIGPVAGRPRDCTKRSEDERCARRESSPNLCPDESRCLGSD